MSLLDVLRMVSKELGLPKNSDFRIISTTTGLPVSRKREIRPLGLSKFLREFDDTTRVATLLVELERRIGAQVGARIELWIAGQRIDGRRGVAGLR